MTGGLRCQESRPANVSRVAILREADRTSVPEISKKYKVSEQTVYVWRRKFGAMEPADVKPRVLREVHGQRPSAGVMPFSQ